jgi:hypothetical protein
MHDHFAKTKWTVKGLSKTWGENMFLFIHAKPIKYKTEPNIKSPFCIALPISWSRSRSASRQRVRLGYLIDGASNYFPKMHNSTQSDQLCYDTHIRVIFFQEVTVLVMKRASCISSIIYGDKRYQVHSFLVGICNHEIHPKIFSFIDATTSVTRPSDIGPMIGCVTGLHCIWCIVKFAWIFPYRNVCLWYMYCKWWGNVPVSVFLMRAEQILKNNYIFGYLAWAINLTYLCCEEGCFKKILIHRIGIARI